MTTDLTAAALIALLRERPGACKLLSVQLMEYDETDFEVLSDDLKALTGVTDECEWRCFRRWLTGAAVEKCDELGICISNDDGGYAYSLPGKVEQGPTWVYFSGVTPVSGFDTRLHALLAGLEAHAKESK